MACPKCGCKETYQFDDHGEDVWLAEDSPLERCAACSVVFYTDDHLPEDDDDEQ